MAKYVIGAIGHGRSHLTGTIHQYARCSGCEYLHENGNCLKVGGFFSSVSDKNCPKMNPEEVIEYGTKVIYHGTDGWENCKCYCGHYNPEDDTYNIFNGWDLCHVPREKIEVHEWED